MRSALRNTLVFFGLLALAVVANLVWPTHTDIRRFDSDRMARLDTDMWRSYYDRKPVLLFFQAGGYARADYERALPQLRRYFSDIHAISTTPFDVDEAARTELEWWIVHRERQAHAPGDLSRALAVAAGVLYRADPARLATYGDERAIAMTIRDDRQAAGGVSEADWTAIDEHLKTSWARLRSALAAGDSTAPGARR